ncbi:helix-turn-helix domain-containing protein [Sharpea azabuensis]|uniref:helix-turn-helix domain-containing protein n=1 Tax=Sharpea azabuensis TaxID=322505 RepID=UPI001569860E|nr:helix-turn-helix transcriptional regulator [Sharpea azabuensis]
MDIGDKIKQLREQKGMTLEELGNKVGVGKSTVRKWETGMIANMRRDKIKKVADALDTSPEFLGYVNFPVF